MKSRFSLSPAVAAASARWRGCVPGPEKHKAAGSAVLGRQNTYGRNRGPVLLCRCAGIFAISEGWDTSGQVGGEVEGAASKAGTRS